MKPIFYATTKQSLAIAKNKQNTFLMVLKPQPPEGYELREVSHGLAIFSDANLIADLEIPLRSPTDTYRVFAPQVVGTNIEWADYKSPPKVPMATEWELDITTSVKRLSELTYKELISIGIFGLTGFCDAIRMQPFIDWWNANNARPLKAKDGKSYECFPYDKFYDYTDDKYYSNDTVGWGTFGEHLDEFYKGLPLFIYANPVIMKLDTIRRTL